MRFNIAFVAPALIAVAIAGQAHESIDGLPRGWTFHSDCSPDEPLELHVSLKNQNIEDFQQHVYDISTPDHELYGEFLEGHEIKSWLQPPKEAHATVTEWLNTHNISNVVPDNDWVYFRTTVGKANDMLKTKFAWFFNKDRNEKHLRTLEYHLPEYLTEHIDFMHPTIKFPSTEQLGSTIHNIGGPRIEDSKAVEEWEAWLETPEAKAGAPPPSLSCGRVIRPRCLLNLYNVHYGGNAKNGNRVAFASFLKQSARYSDLRKFQNLVAPYTRGRNFTVVTYSGAKNDQTSSNDATEANLDNQYQFAVGHPTPVTEYITKGCGPLNPDPNEPAGSCSNEPYLAFLKGILAVPNSKLPQTISISYGEDEQTWPRKLADKVCNQFAQLGARGVSVIFSSGDSGPGAKCLNNKGTKAKFTPAFPAGCPFVTTIGATQGYPVERAASFSGGGFSNYWKQPKYQAKAVNAYLKKLGNKQAKYFNAEGRGYPDIAAQGVNYIVASAGVLVPVSGTSASGPTIAGIVALLNSARISAGKKSLGFLNPFLYSKGEAAFMDIVRGGSIGCGQGKIKIPNASWNATVGWDPATGLGTPNFGKLLHLVAPGTKNTGGPIGG